MSLRVLLVDDHAIFREALRRLLMQQPGIDVVADTGKGGEVVELACATLPDIICLDIGIPDMSGIDVMRELARRLPSVKVIALSSFVERQFVVDMMHAGASAYVTKGEAYEELSRAFDFVQRNHKYFCPEIAGVMMDTFAAEGGAAAIPLVLSGRERQALQLVAQGLTSGQAAKQMGIAPSTVDVHRRNIMRKLQMHNVAELTRYAIQRGLL